MKKNYLLSAAAAFLLAVTGCSDDIENGGNSGGEGDSGKVEGGIDEGGRNSF